jgi:hypothetical protein
MDPKEKAIEELRKRIREQKARVDPDILAAAAKAAEKRRSDSARKKDFLPYDRKAAAKAVEIFLKTHANAAEFRAKLLRFLKKDGE